MTFDREPKGARSAAAQPLARQLRPVPRPKLEQNDAERSGVEEKYKWIRYDLQNT
jgi:hypothetical protein